MVPEMRCERCEALERRCGELERQVGELSCRLEHAVCASPGVDPDEVQALTSREVEVLELIAQGLSTDEIGERLYLSRNSVKTHTRKLYRKIGVSNRTEAAVWALSRSGSDGHGPSLQDDGSAPSPRPRRGRELA